MSDFLVGKTIIDVLIADDKKALLFKCEDGDHVVRADGDCCSDTWIEHVETPALGFPATVLAVSELDMPEGEERSKYGVTKLYGCKIETDKGEIVIDYRNESNGYYGGNLCWPDDRYFYGGVFGQNDSTNNFVALGSVGVEA